MLLVSVRPFRLGFLLGVGCLSPGPLTRGAVLTAARASQTSRVDPRLTAKRGQSPVLMHPISTGSASGSLGELHVPANDPDLAACLRDMPDPADNALVIFASCIPRIIFMHSYLVSGL